MTIIEALKKENSGLRLTNGMGRWMVWWQSSNMWVVFERGYGKRSNTCLIETDNLDDAIEELDK